MSLVPFFGAPLFQHPFHPFDVGLAPVKSDKEYTYEVPVPGMTKANLEVYVDSNTVFVRGSRGSVVELRCAFSLPRDADVSKVSASVQDGLLTIASPRIAAGRLKTARKIEIQ